MLFAINYSTQAAALFAGNRIQVDRFKCPDWPDMITEASRLCQVVVHSNLKAGRGNLGNKDWDKISRLIEQTETPFINLHLESRGEDFPGIPLDTTDALHTEQIVDCMLNDLEIIVKRFGAERVIAENVPYRGVNGKILRPVAEPAVIRRVLEKSGCGLLLDISHARIAAHYIGMDERGYMSQLPVEWIRELHFTGAHNLDGWWQDHMGALEADWKALGWVLENIRVGKWHRPWLLAFEYGGVGEKFAYRSDAQVIAEQASHLYTMVKTV